MFARHPHHVRAGGLGQVVLRSVFSHGSQLRGVPHLPRQQRRQRLGNMVSGSKFAD